MSFLFLRFIIDTELKGARIYSLFRIVPGDVFVTDFASDRSHMVSGLRSLLPLFEIRNKAM